LDKDLDPSFFDELLDVQELVAIREYVKGEAMKKANVHYLEYESIEFTTASGRAWRVYGSPVSDLVGLRCAVNDGPSFQGSTYVCKWGFSVCREKGG
jgi:hypothetical protein